MKLTFWFLVFALCAEAGKYNISLSYSFKENLCHIPQDTSIPGLGRGLGGGAVFETNHSQTIKVTKYFPITTIYKLNVFNPEDSSFFSL